MFVLSFAILTLWLCFIGTELGEQLEKPNEQFTIPTSVQAQMDAAKEKEKTKSIPKSK